MKPEQILEDAVNKDLKQGWDTAYDTFLEMKRDIQKEIAKLSMDLACTQKDLDRELRRYADYQLELSKIRLTEYQTGISEEEFEEISPEDLPF